MLIIFNYLFSEVFYVLQRRSRQLPRIRHPTSKWLTSSQGRGMAFRSKFQSCSASCSASSTWKSFALWASMTWNHSQSGCHIIMCYGYWPLKNAQFSGTAIQCAMNPFAVAIAQSPSDRERKHVRQNTGSAFLHRETEQELFFYLE